MSTITEKTHSILQSSQDTEKGHNLTKDSRLSKQMKKSQSHRRGSLRNSEILKSENCKVVKLIGDKQKNIEEMAVGINCICGCVSQFKNILTLLMDKIYRLRQERNACRLQLQSVKNMPNNLKTSASIAVNTEIQSPLNDMKEQLRRLIEESQLGFDSISLSNSNHVPIQEKEEPLKKHRPSTAFQEEERFDESNLLEDSVHFGPFQNENCKSQLAQSGAYKSRPLRQSNRLSNNNNLSHLCSFFKKNCLNINTLQNYIQKVNCAKEIDRFSTKKGYGDIF